MKTTYIFGWLAAVVLLAAACTKSNDVPVPQPEPELELKSVIAGKHWVSGNYFTYIYDGIEKVDTIMSLETHRISIGLWADPFLYLGTFFCNEDATSVDKYWMTPFEGSEEDRDLLVYRGLYSLFLNPETNTIRLTANNPRVAENHIYEGMTLRLRSLAEDHIEFDMDINDFVRLEWAPFFEKVETPLTFTGIRVIWKSVSEETAAEYRYFQDPIDAFSR